MPHRSLNRLRNRGGSNKSRQLKQDRRSMRARQSTFVRRNGYRSKRVGYSLVGRSMKLAKTLKSPGGRGRRRVRKRRGGEVTGTILDATSKETCNYNFDEKTKRFTYTPEGKGSVALDLSKGCLNKPTMNASRGEMELRWTKTNSASMGDTIQTGRMHHFKAVGNDEKCDFHTLSEALQKALLSSPPCTLEEFLEGKKLYYLARGGYGRVFRVDDENDKTGGEASKYAIKVVEKKLLTGRVAQRGILEERKNLEILNSCPFIVNLHYAFDTHSYYCLVLDYCEHGELFAYIRSKCFRDGGKKLTHLEAHKKIRMYAAELYLAIHELHSKGIIYRDLKPENILMDGEGHIRLADLGLCKQADTTGSFCGTPEYKAPEQLTSPGLYTNMIDWWAFGTLVYEMIAGIPPFYHRSQKKMLEQIVNDPLTWKGDTASIKMWNDQQTAKDFLSRLLNKNPNNRLGSDNEEKIQTHAYFQGINWEKMSVNKEWKFNQTTIEPYKEDESGTADEVFEEDDLFNPGKKIPVNRTEKGEEWEKKLLDDVRRSDYTPDADFEYNTPSSNR